MDPRTHIPASIASKIPFKLPPTALHTEAGVSYSSVPALDSGLRALLINFQASPANVSSVTCVPHAVTAFSPLSTYPASTNEVPCLTTHLVH